MMKHHNKIIAMIALLLLGCLSFTACDKPKPNPTPNDSIPDTTLHLSGTHWGFHDEYDMQGTLMQINYDLRFFDDKTGHLESLFEIVGYPEYTTRESADFSYTFNGTTGTILPTGVDDTAPISMEYQSSTQTLVLGFPTPGSMEVIAMPFTQFTDNN